MKQTHKFNGTVIPMFLPTQMEQPMANNDPTHIKGRPQAELSVFDVKELYDLAYSYKETDDAKFKNIMVEAVQMDMQYRRQIAQKANNYTTPTKETNVNDSQVA